MATNTGKGFRRGSVDDRTQVFNPQNERWVKRDTDTGQFVGQKEDGSPYSRAWRKSATYGAIEKMSRDIRGVHHIAKARQCDPAGVSTSQQITALASECGLRLAPALFRMDHRV